jgi:hypothetical protein
MPRNFQELPGQRQRKFLYTHLRPAMNPPRDMLITKTQLRATWRKVRKNLHALTVIDQICSTRYRVLHDIHLTHVRLHTIRVQPTDQCPHCHAPDTLRHCPPTFTRTLSIWDWTCRRIAFMHRTDKRYVPYSLSGSPPPYLRSTQCHNAILWMTAHMAQFILDGERTLTLYYCLNFLRCARRKTNKWRKRQASFGNYLATRT